MTLEEALAIAACEENTVRDDDALVVLAAEVRRLTSEPIYSRMAAANGKLRATLGNVEALVPQLSTQARALRFGNSKWSQMQALAIEGVVQQLKLALSGEP